MFFILGTLPILTALIGFVTSANAPQQNIAGITSEEVFITPTISLSEPEASPSRRPTITPKQTPTVTDILVYPSKSPEAGVTDLLQQINSFRAGKGLPPLAANSETCFFAKTRVFEIMSNFSHDEFRQRIDSKTLPYPSWSEVAENIAMNSDPDKVVPGWITSSGHNENLSKDVPYGCVVSNGNHFVFEAWKP
ncbi:MAG: hypothetical protein HYW63_03380 [Candidatus Levybacteria bacterium]|nr:hypothetical protein [Candidatus Levybacteria bacterium]